MVNTSNLVSNLIIRHLIIINRHASDLSLVLLKLVNQPQQINISFTKIFRSSIQPTNQAHKPRKYAHFKSQMNAHENDWKRYISGVFAPYTIIL